MELIFLLMLVVLMAAALGSGFPVAFALPGSAILTIGAAAFFGYMIEGDTSAYFFQGGPAQWLSAGVTNFRGVYWEVERDTLIAIPLFVFMGIMLQRSKIAEDLLVTMAQLFGPMPGGLGISVVFVGALLAATTGIVGATVVAMGLISLPAMMRNRYSNSLATGTIAASGTLGQIIPPSIVLIILADQLASAVDQASTARKNLYKESTGELTMPSEFDVISTSAGDMFMGALVPGMVLVGLYMLYILVIALVRPKMAPAVHFEGQNGKEFALRVLLILVPPLTLIFIVLGSIITGIATVNQAGAIGAVGATIMAGYRLYSGNRFAFFPAALALIAVVVLIAITQFSPVNIKNLRDENDVFSAQIAAAAAVLLLIAVLWSGWRTWRIEDTLKGVLIETAKTTALVFVILLGAAMLTAAFRAFGGEELVRDFLTSLPGGFWGQLIIVMAVIFFLGFFLDFIEIAVVVVPIVAPILLAEPSANVTAVWLGVMIGLNIQTSFLTPPFGFALFYLRGVASKAIKTVEMYRGVIAFILLQLAALGIVATYPKLVNYLPTRLALTSDTAPPPANPRLQPCIEENLLTYYEQHEPELRAIIEPIAQLDTSQLPDKQAKNLNGAIDSANEIFALTGAIRAAEAAVREAAIEYRPIHSEVRSLERQVKGIDREIAELQERMEQNPELQNSLEAKIAALDHERGALLDQIPGDWDDRHKAFQALLNDETKARRAYRRSADKAYSPVQELVALIGDADQLTTLEPDLLGLRDVISTYDPQSGGDKIRAVARLFSDIEGASAIRSPLSKARSELTKKTNREKALAQLEKAIEAYEAEKSWRLVAQPNLLAPLQSYEQSTRHTLGLRQQSRLPQEIALEIVGCTAAHRDISLHF